MLMIIYFLIGTITFTVITWMMISVIYNSQFPPGNDDDGGLFGDQDLPLIDIPPGGTVDDILVDRWHEDVNHPTFRA